MSDIFLIERDNQELSQRDDHPRVFVTGPHYYGGGIRTFSSTTDPADASRFTAEEAAAWIAECRWGNARVVRVGAPPRRARKVTR